MKYKFRYKIFAEALYDALQEDSFYNTIEKSIDYRSTKEAMVRYFDYSIVESEQYGDVVVPPDHCYGISVWTKPLRQDLETERSKKKKEFLEKYMGGASLSTYNSIVDFMSEKASSLVPENAWYLSILGVLPQHQGKGLGVGLVDKILDQTDKAGIPTYLETFTPKNISFYERLGYKQLECIYEPTTEADYCIMMREPLK
ncbi:GNAT family N-acetyltransferase [Desulfopila aestuarii]|nr:GNAT family N-acetyltransferase [Desulfopila aestuarii]